MTRALVLGGGGPVGIGWEAGLISGLAAAGVVVSESDAVIGTSAGSAVGAQLLSGGALEDAVELSREPPSLVGTTTDLATLTDLLVSLAIAEGTEETRRSQLGRLALDTWIVPEHEFIARFALFNDREWPDRFACTAVDTGTGAFRVWDKAAGVELDRAVASSCAVPTITEPITIGGLRYMDGGMRSALNADLAVGHDIVLVVSCMTLVAPPGFDDPRFNALLASFQAQFEALRDSGATVQTIGPGEEFLGISGWGLHLMDFSRVEAAFQAGVRQGAVEAKRLAGFWGA